MRTPMTSALRVASSSLPAASAGSVPGSARFSPTRGATVVTCARRPGDVPYEFHSCDVRDEESVDTLIGAIVAAHGRLDAVVNNAGARPSRSLPMPVTISIARSSS